MKNIQRTGELTGKNGGVIVSPRRVITMAPEVVDGYDGRE